MMIHTRHRPCERCSDIVDPPSDLTTYLEAIPQIWQVLLFAGILIGLVLWLLGRKIARPACAIGGLVTAACAAAIFSRHMDSPPRHLGLIVGGGVLGCVLAYLLFRVWMGITCAVLLGLVLPMLTAIWFDPPTQHGPGNVELLLVNPENGGRDQDDDENQKNKAEAESDPQATEQFFDGLERMRKWVGHDLRTWWETFEPATQQTYLLTAGMGALIGLLLGLIFPYVAASIESSLTGTLLVACCGLLLLNLYTDINADLTVQNTKTLATAVGLITAVGVVLQWMVFRRKADA